MVGSGLSGRIKEQLPHSRHRSTVGPVTLYGHADVVKVVVVRFVPGLKVPLGDPLQAVPV